MSESPATTPLFRALQAWRTDPLHPHWPQRWRDEAIAALDAGADPLGAEEVHYRATVPLDLAQAYRRTGAPRPTHWRGWASSWAQTTREGAAVLGLYLDDPAPWPDPGEWVRAFVRHLHEPQAPEVWARFAARPDMHAWLHHPEVTYPHLWREARIPVEADDLAHWLTALAPLAPEVSLTYPDGDPLICRHHEHARLWIEAGADPNQCDRHGSTALHRALMFQAEASVATLLACGANPNQENHDGFTPLRVVLDFKTPWQRAKTWTVEQRVQAVRQLLEAGADPEASTRDGQRVWDHVAALPYEHAGPLRALRATWEAAEGLRATLDQPLRAAAGRLRL